MKNTVVLLAALASGTAFGACEDVTLMERPDVPNGLEASFEEMLDAREAVVAYVKSGEAYLECFNPEPFVYNYMADRLERKAEEFNRERERFLEQRGVVASN